MKIFARWATLSILLIFVLGLMLFNVVAQGNSTGSTAFATNTPLATSAAPLSVVTPTPTAQPQIEAVPLIFEAEECAYVPGQPTSAACEALFEEYGTEPNVKDIQADTNTLSQYSFWRVGPQAVTTYDAPGGAPIGNIPAGFNFINAITETEAWLQDEEGEWINIEEASAYYVPASYFTGVTLPDGWADPFGEVVDRTGIYASTYPGGPPTEESGLIPLRYERYNIYAEAVDDEGWTWYMIGPNQWIKQVFMSVIKPVERPEGVSGRWVAIDLFEQTLIAYEDDTPVFATLISSGLPDFSTNEGLFTVWARLARDGMSGATGAPDAYALQSVPWVQYFDESISLHGTYWHDDFGYRRSHGCVNLSISDSRWLFEWMESAEPNEAGEVVNHVYVFSSDDYR